MKKLILLLFFIPVQLKAPEKTYKVEGDLKTWQVLIDCLDKSSAPHNQVKAVQDWIVGQLQKQITDSTNSTKKK